MNQNSNIRGGGGGVRGGSDGCGVRDGISSDGRKFKFFFGFKILSEERGKWSSDIEYANPYGVFGA